MLTKTGKIVCDYCGRFISYVDLMAGLASHELLTPDSEFTSEEYDSFHHICLKRAARMGVARSRDYV